LLDFARSSFIKIQKAGTPLGPLDGGSFLRKGVGGGQVFAVSEKYFYDLIVRADLSLGTGRDSFSSSGGWCAVGSPEPDFLGKDLKR
jgi:hypothetical protein